MGGGENGERRGDSREGLQWAEGEPVRKAMLWVGVEVPMSKHGLGINHFYKL